MITGLWLSNFTRRQNNAEQICLVSILEVCALSPRGGRPCHAPLCWIIDDCVWLHTNQHKSQQVTSDCVFVVHSPNTGRGLTRKRQSWWVHEHRPDMCLQMEHCSDPISPAWFLFSWHLVRAHRGQSVHPLINCITLLSSKLQTFLKNMLRLHLAVLLYS